MRKKLDTRFPAARIKKIMQADEDVGKIAMAVPLLVSKALELFLQDLCDQTYEITLRRGAKTMNAFHLKQCVQTFNVFDFLKDIVSKVPDLGSSVATGDDHAVTKRRKVAGDDDNDSDEELKRNKKPEPGHSSGRGRGRGRGRGIRTADQEMGSHAKCEDDSHVLKQNDNHQSNESMENASEPAEVKQSFPVSKPTEVCIRNFDLNLDPDEDMDSLDTPTSVQASSSAKSVSEEKHEEYPGWPLSDMEKMTIDPIQLANINGRIDEDEEDYDEEM
ncbi:hypothetical protein AAZX31_14G037400 [Glycine max]|nr:hypothetical protein JHK86_038926 [Glycine max]KAG5120810.1 hypothetical protein JHK84_039150 [Glycine max]